MLHITLSIPRFSALLIFLLSVCTVYDSAKKHS
nr:MAG TPA: hypothetical protein [Caudoviricetes sp.]DAW12395.1 MAG TPA: hypothetical protein [Caudoviricetes sp.]